MAGRKIDKCVYVRISLLELKERWLCVVVALSEGMRIPAAILSHLADFLGRFSRLKILRQEKKKTLPRAIYESGTFFLSL